MAVWDILLKDMEKLRKEEYVAITGKRAPAGGKGYGKIGGRWSWSWAVDR